MTLLLGDSNSVDWDGATIFQQTPAHFGSDKQASTQSGAIAIVNELSQKAAKRKWPLGYFNNYTISALKA